jgi:hypothetical protein
LRRWFGILAALLIMVALLPGAAVADCAVRNPAASIGAVPVILYGKVTEVDQRSRDTYYTVSAQTIYKGEPENPVILHIKSGRNQSTSIDHTMRQDELHTLYLLPDGKGYYATDVCQGSHLGPPTADEVQAGLGAGRPAPPEQPARRVSPFRNWIPFIAIGVAFGAMGAVLLINMRRKRRA